MMLKRFTPSFGVPSWRVTRSSGEQFMYQLSLLFHCIQNTNMALPGGQPSNLKLLLIGNSSVGQSAHTRSTIRSTGLTTR
jgi:hypothetical protein